MKLNKLHVQPKTKHVEPKTLNEVTTPAQCFLRYLKEDGTYHRETKEADETQVGSLPNLSPTQVELVKAACTQAKAIPEDSDIQELHFFCGCNRADVKFNEVTKQPEIVGTTEEAGLSKVGNELKQLKDEPDYQATETVEVTEEVTEVIGDKAVVKKVTKTVEIPLTDEIPCVDEDGNGICDICNTTHEKFPIVKPKMIQVPRMIEGKKVSEEDKARLAELLGNL
jgi:hypothetical protein